MKKYVFIAVILFAGIFYGCSWREEFVIKNMSGSPYRIVYVLDKDAGAFPVFTDHPSVYPLTNSGEPDWGKDMAFADEDGNLQTVSIMLPPKSVLVFGHLSNDHYKKYDQQFINGRKFNLSSVKIGDVSISPSTFDQHFRKKNGLIVYTIK